MRIYWIKTEVWPRRTTRSRQAHEHNVYYRLTATIRTGGEVCGHGLVRPYSSCRSRRLRRWRRTRREGGRQPSTGRYTCRHRRTRVSVRTSAWTPGAPSFPRPCRRRNVRRTGRTLRRGALSSRYSRADSERRRRRVYTTGLATTAGLGNAQEQRTCTYRNGGGPACALTCGVGVRLSAGRP